MEMREELRFYNEIEVGQIELEDFINNCEAGIDLAYSFDDIIHKTVEQIKEELILDDIYEVYYIEDYKTMRILLNNGCQYFLVRV